MIRCQYVPSDHSEVSSSCVLAAVAFDDTCIGRTQDAAISTGLSLIAGDSVKEHIVSSGEVKRGQGDGVLWAEDGEHLVVAVWANEQANPAATLETIAFELYQTLFQTMADHGFSHLVRVWNYFADINAEPQGLERYRQFCLGRYQAFEGAGLAEGDYPSACALGHHGGNVLVYALASKQAPQHFENPKQQAAYHYPEQYGPRSPSFARATVLGRTLYVSGTASVVGHKTLHVDDVQAQTRTTLENLAQLIGHIALQQRIPVGRWQASILKVYIRNPQDISTIQPLVAQAYAGVPCVFLAADVCRSDLLLEIDGIWQLNQ